MSQLNLINVEKTNTMFFSRKVSNAQEKVRGMLKAEFMKWIFRFAIIKLRLQLRYLAYEQQFKTWDKLLFTLTRDTLPKSDLYTSGTRKICTKPVFCPFRNHWINFWIVVRVLRAQLGLIWVRQIQVWPYFSVDEQCEFLDRMDFDAIFQQINLRCQWAMWVYTPEI